MCLYAWIVCALCIHNIGKFESTFQRLYVSELRTVQRLSQNDEILQRD